MRAAEEWGRLAVSLPGWRWMPGMLTDVGERVTDPGICYLGTLPDPDDPATGGALLVLAGAPHRLLPTVEAWIAGAPVEGITSLGRAVIADVRDQWGRWPGGEE